MNNQNQRQYRQVTGGSNNPRWEPHKEQFDPNNPPFLAGYFRDFREQPGGQNGSFMVATIHLLDQAGNLDQEVDVAASTVLEEALNKIDLGTWIGIKFCGKVTPKGKGNPYNMWEVFVDDTATPYQQMGGTVAQKKVIPQQNNNQQSNNNQQNFQNQGNQNQGNQFNNAGQNQPFKQNTGPANNQGNQNTAAPVFNTGNNNAQNQNPQQNQNQQKPWTPQQNNNQQSNNNQQNFQNQGNQNQGNNNTAGNNKQPIFTGNVDDNDDLPF